MPQTGTTYMRVAESLRQRVLAGGWKPGEQLPTEAQLCETFGASRITIRRALQILAEERLVQRRQGAGTFVSPKPVRKIPIFNTDFFASVTRHAPDMTRRIEHMTWRQANDSDPEELGLLPNDRLLQMVRVDELRGEPVAMDEVLIPEHYADRLTEADWGVMDFLKQWEQVQGIRLDYCSQTIEAVAATESHIRLLNVNPGDPLLRETNIVYLPGGEAAGHFVSHYRNDYFRFDATIQIGTRAVPGQNREAVNG